MIWFLLEILVALCFGAGIIAESFHLKAGNTLTGLAMLLCLLVYGLLGAITLKDHVNKQNKILLSALAGFSFGLAGVSIWFKLVQLPGTFFLSIGTMFLLTLSFGFTYLSEQKQESAFRRYHGLLMLRFMIFSALVLLSIWIPDTTVLRWKYGHQPELRDIKIRLRENPSDTALQRQEKLLIQKYEATAP